VPSTRVTAMKGKALQHGNHIFLAQSASVVGDVTVGELSGVYYGAVVRGESLLPVLSACLGSVNVLQATRAQ